MAQVKYGSGIVQMSGSIAGDVHARNRFGNYIRPRTKPVNPKSSRQTGIRTILMFLAEQWRESPMTPTIREAWETYAASVSWNNRLGEQVTLTGFNMFIMCNAARITAGGSLITAAPTVLGLPPGDPTFAVSGSASTQELSVVFDPLFDWNIIDDGLMSVYMGRPQSASRNFFGGPYRFADAIEGDTASPPTSPQTMTAPFTLVEGQKIWCRARIQEADARVSTLFTAAPFECGA
ncbi:MAG TPA: hypothetical protein VMW50_15165 [Dehalococcoidia bacterium]|nr:hypothetical protein [Dehalococcoidia bacterium]